MKTDDPNRTRPPPVPLPEPEPEPDPVDDDETGEPTVDDMVEAVLDGEAQQRLWLRDHTAAQGSRTRVRQSRGPGRVQPDLACGV